MPINQKGASGIIAEYAAVVHLAKSLREFGFHVRNSNDDDDDALIRAIARVGNELSPALVARSTRAGVAIADFVRDQLTSEPERLGLSLSVGEILVGSIFVEASGHSTNSGDPADLVVWFESGGRTSRLPISLKTYNRPQSSLGSKSARAALTRLFLDSEKTSDMEFKAAFGDSGARFLELLMDYKIVAQEFYTSQQGEDFLDSYELRKGSRKVNNPLRRKEVGDYFASKRGFKSEHKFAELFSEIFNENIKRIESNNLERRASFMNQFKFLLGNPEMLVLDARTAGEDAIELICSLEHPVYKNLNTLLRPESSVEIVQKRKNSMLDVEIHCDESSFKQLSLSMWKDATIQFKLDSSYRI